jgi:hypothetical protein
MYMAWCPVVIFQSCDRAVYVLNHDAYDRAEELGELLDVPVGLDLPAGERATKADILVVLGPDFAE